MTLLGFVAACQSATNRAAEDSRLDADSPVMAKSCVGTGAEPISVTVERFDGADAERRLRHFLTATSTGPRFVPRGLERDAVLAVLGDLATASSDPLTWSRSVEVMRFYETTELVAKLLDDFESARQDRLDSSALHRNLARLRVAFEIGEATERATARDRLEWLIRDQAMTHQDLHAVAELLPTSSDPSLVDPFQERLARERREMIRSKDGARAVDALNALIRDGVPRALYLIRERERIAALDPADRRRTLATLYLGISPLSRPDFVAWAALELRRDAWRCGIDPIVAALESVPAANPPPTNPIVQARLAEAISYLRVTIARTRGESVESGAPFGEGLLSERDDGN